MKHLEVVCALIENGNKEYFICQRGKGQLANKWEFPGGKIENNETREEAITREILEELKIKIEVLKYLGQSSYEYTNLANPFSITIYAYLSKIKEGKIVLTEHKEAHFVKLSDLDKWEFAEADYELIKIIKKELSKGESY